MLTSTSTTRMPENATLVPKHVGANIYYEVRIMICFILFSISALFWLKYAMQENARCEYKENVKIYGFVGTINNRDGN